MPTRTRTTTTHYHIQKKRRAEFLEEWRSYRQTVIRAEDVKLVPTARGLRSGVFMGRDGGRPTRCLDAHQDKACGNETAFYPPLSRNVHVRPAAAIESSYGGIGLRETWRDFDRRGAYVGSFEVR